MRRHPLAILFSIWGRHSPARKAGMTEAYRQVGGASRYWLFSHSRFFVLPKRRKALRINQKWKGVQSMKYHAVWKPGGRSRGGMGSMKPGRRQLQAVKPRGTVPGREAIYLGGTKRSDA